MRLAAGLDHGGLQVLAEPFPAAVARGRHTQARQQAFRWLEVERDAPNKKKIQVKFRLPSCRRARSGLPARRTAEASAKGQEGTVHGWEPPPLGRPPAPPLVKGAVAMLADCW